MDLEDIKAIVALMQENDLSVFELERDGVKLKLQKGAQLSAAPAPALMSAPATGPGGGGSQASSAPPAAAEQKSDGPPLKEVVSPMVGTFYRATSPDASPFVDVGSSVDEESVVCIIEAMKVMNEIKAEVTGTIAEVVAENGKPVQFGQILFRVK